MWYVISKNYSILGNIIFSEYTVNRVCHDVILSTCKIPNAITVWNIYLSLSIDVNQFCYNVVLFFLKSNNRDWLKEIIHSTFRQVNF